MTVIIILVFLTTYLSTGAVYARKRYADELVGHENALASIKYVDKKDRKQSSSAGIKHGWNCNWHYVVLYNSHGCDCGAVNRYNNQLEKNPKNPMTTMLGFPFYALQSYLTGGTSKQVNHARLAQLEEEAFKEIL